MKAEILAVGTELLLGDILNTNAQYLARELADLGISVYYQSVVGDNSERLKKAYEIAFNRADLVITTGGLGPTEDDLTKEIAGEYFNKKLILDENSLDKIKEYFKMYKRPLGKGNIKQAYFPKGSIVLPNDHGTAPGCIVEKHEKVLILLPGPPREVIPMFENYVKPYLLKYQEGVLVSKVLRICGIGESHMEEQIKDIVASQTNPTVAPYAKEGEVTLRITAKGKTLEEAEDLIAPVKKEIYSRLGEFIYGEGNTTLEEEIAKVLIHKNKTIAVAESCTGGLISSKFINFSGISSVFMEGMVTYSNEAKIHRLNVKKETLEKYGAVSKETAIEMAEGISKTANTDIGLSVTGIAGPNGGSEEKPVGLVYIGIYINGQVKVKELFLKGDRNRIRNLAVVRALDFLRKEIS